MAPSSVTERIAQTAQFLQSTVLGVQIPNQIPWSPDSKSFPSRKDLPKLPGAPEGAAWVWGEEDYIGRLNLLTPKRVKGAASSEIRTGEIIRLDLPLSTPEQPSFGRDKFVHKIIPLAEDLAYDDKYDLNTQSGSQWDGFRHFAHFQSRTFYNGTKGSDILGPTANPSKCSIHHWSNHGIAGRGILLDYWGYAVSQNIKYDAFTGHSISYTDLQNCGKAQGIDIRPASQGGDIQVGDILFIRSGWTDRYNRSTPQERETAALRHGEELEYAGVKQEEAMIDWLHDCYFAAVVGDAPSFERWPTAQKWYLHEYILALWGMPLGEMWDLEELAEKCRREKRWTFFVTSAPANVIGGVGSHPNATAIF